ncbi:MAG: AbiA family abortive infection protein [Chloroflexi bacterium]|nr:AbiA family abortive infection protein [Chloroflexota bacterium]MBP8056225.1 AbiA family abortive infection protein [Chloroflexota bacterium]
MGNGDKNLGYFLTYEIWQDALRLLNAQVEGQESNKHFKTLSMIYYKKLGSSVKQLETIDFFESYVTNNLFYGLESEFAIYSYVIPKSGLGLRNYKFFTYPMRAIYDSIGLYLLKLSDEFLINYYRKNSNIRSFYGGGIHFENDRLVITKNNIYFSSYYRKFRNEIRKELKADEDNRVIIRIDIQNYYDEISIPILLEQFRQNYKDSEKARLNFDTTTEEQIAFFFRFLANASRGIPQSDNSIISSIIGHLYLVFGDLVIDSELRKDADILERYKIIRYVDDVFVSLKFKNSVTNSEQKEYIESIGARISDLLFYKLGLRLNPKTRFFWLDNPKHLEDLKTSLKKVSPQYYSGLDEIDDETLENKVHNIFDELRKLKKSNLEPETFEHELADEILKEIFDKRVAQVLEKAENKKRIREIFRNFDFNRVKEYPLPMIIVILKDKTVEDAFRAYLLNRKNITSKDVDLMLTYLCQNDFTDNSVLRLMEKYLPMSKIISKITSCDLAHLQPGYYGLHSGQVQRLCSMTDVIEQIRHRVFNERIGSYSVALNHLLNELHGICYQIDDIGKKSKEYDANQVVQFLQTQGISHHVCIGVRRLFDRRNTNQVSHPGSANFLAWSVSQLEYLQYQQIVSECLGVLVKPT